MPISTAARTSTSSLRERAIGGRVTAAGKSTRARCAPGFTLLELAVVLFLMSLILLIAVPYLGGITDAQLKSTSRQMAGRGWTTC